MEYRAPSSVWSGNDADLLEMMIEFYRRIPAEPILDATYNAGRFWRGSTRRVISMDVSDAYDVDIVADNRTMVGRNRRTGEDAYRVPDESFGVVVYDPPHVGPQGRQKSVKRFDVDYGAHVRCDRSTDWSLSYLYPDFLTQARRVLRPDGLLLAKITDQVNSHRSRWSHVDFMTMAGAAGFTVCDLIVKVRNGPMVSSRWKRARHARKRHCFWIICRNGDRCE